MIRQFVLLFLGLLAGSQLMLAQGPDSFSEEPRAFMNELKDFMTASKQKVMEDLYDTFSDQMDAALYTPEEFQVIRTTANAMLAQRMPPNPYFTEYFQALVLVKDDAAGAQRFTEWHGILNEMLTAMESRKYKPYQLFLQFSAGFFERKAFRVTTTGMNWYADSDNLKMAFKDGEPQIYFSELDLHGVRGSDSIMISKTSGTFLPAEEVFNGKGGRVTWERFGLSPDIYIELGSFQIEVKKSLYEVADAKLHYPQFFGDQLVAGKFEDKVMSNIQQNMNSYPRFETNESRVEIENIGEGVSYRGGFRLQGTTVYGIGNTASPAVIEIRKPDNSLSFRGSAESFTIRRGELIVADQVDGTVYFGQDSLYHPSVNVRFEIESRELELTRGNRASDKNPFFSSMHQMNLEADKINYYMNGDSILIGEKTLNISKRNTPVVFESLQFFSENDYYRFQNISTYNPIAVIRAVADRDGRVLNADYLAERIDSRFSVENIQSLLYDLVEKGFVDYDSDLNEVVVKDKIFHYVDASQKKVDYDFLRIESETKETNAVFLPTKGEMLVEGVDYIEFSQAQKVAVNPYGGQVEFGPNRNLDFGGRIYAGLTTLDGKDFHFEYDPFHVVLDSVRYFNMFFLSDSLDGKGNQVGLSLASRIEHLSGVLLIDAPANKAGLEDIALFPSLNSKRNSFVYYDFIEGFKGSYKRDSFYFELKPFSLNGLDKYNRADIAFKGKMVSAGIFPDFEETLVIREEDESLGFVSETPKEGYPTYGGKGEYVGNVDLSNRGFLGQGTLTYLGASINSEDIIFQPNLTTGSAREFFMSEVRTGGVEVPQAKGIDVSLEWRPYKDSMYIYSQEAPFEIFQDGLHNLEGTLVLTPTGLKGKGLFSWDKADMRSSLFSFGAHSIQADTTNLRIKAFDSDKLAMVTENLNGSVDFDKGVGSFHGNGETLISELPFNQYETSMQAFDWDINAERVTFMVDPGEKGRFLSVHPDQDSLRFEWETTTFDLKTNELDVGGVDYIISADAFIYPSEGKVKIGPGGRIDSLFDARIVADTLSQYHVINRATVQVLGRKDFTARGFYEYNIGDRAQEIDFQDIVGERVGKGNRRTKPVATRATGEVSPEDRFYIDTKTEFRGKIQLSSDRPELHFNGFARLDSNLPNPHWFTVDFDGDKRDLSIRFEDPRNYEGEMLETGLFLSKETTRIYPRVMAPLFFRKDRPILQVKGLFNYDEERDQFIFSDSLKMVEQGQLKGNKLVYNNATGKVEAEGRIILGDGLKYISIESAGELTTDINVVAGDTLTGGPLTSAIVQGEIMAGINLILPDDLVKVFENDFLSSSFDASPVVYAGDANFYMKAASELFEDNQDVRQAIAGVTLNDFAIPSKFNKYTFLFPKIPVKWDPDYQSFVSTKTVLALASINGEVYNRNITAYFECKMPIDDDDRLYLYIKSPGGFYYFFGFKQGIMSVVSDNTRFNDIIINMKDNDRIYKMDDGNTYEIQAVDPSTASAFLRRVQAVQ
ncbi:MAG: hypothetical protein KDC34_17360 [Saprospiraceae bacterium]|nr:hypothetical protein [Saprospiraceae bacterium]